MNVLLFTTSMILLLAALTYARIETYRSLSLLQGQFNQYMALSERGEINKRATLWYQTSAATRKAGQGTEKKGKKEALSRLSFLVFIDSKKQSAHSEEYPQLSALAAKLIYVLYKDQPFYREMENKRPDFVNALLSSLMIVENLSTTNLPQNQKITRAADLANLNLQDSELNELFYKMLQGTMRPEWGTDPQNNPCQQVGEQGEEEDETIEPGKQEEIKSPSGYYSLLDFITLQDAVKVRVFLAPRALLLAIFDDPATVTALIEMRCNLYQNVVNNTLTAEQATQTFRTQFLPQSKGFDEKILDFGVTKTNPRNYE